MSTIPAGLCQCGCGEETKVSPYNDTPRGYVRDAPMRFVLGHQSRGKKKTERYEVRDCGFSTPCWVWLLAKTPNGYSHLEDKVLGYAGTAHRWYFEERSGPVPSGAHLDHLCRNRACVNPEHLECVTAAENSRRGAGAKLTYEALKEIARLRSQGWTQVAVARRFGVSRQTIGDIEQGRTWSAPGGLVTS